jgi:hypothetical protein
MRTTTTTILISTAALAAVAAQPAMASAKQADPASSATPKVSLCAPVAVKTFHGTRMEANCRLARLDHGKVPCVHAGTGKVTECTFTASSGEWLQGTRGGIFAVAGQPISRSGRRGGPFTIASGLGKDGRPPCAAPDKKPVARAADSAGVPGSVDLGGACTIEVMGSARNAYDRPIQNYATKEVCVNSFPHPDGATMVRQPSPGLYCYAGLGAALNNQGGRELDQYGRAVPGPEACHVAWTAPPAQGGKEVFAAKRPNWVAYPLPGHIVTNSPIVWRSYYRGASIGN